MALEIIFTKIINIENIQNFYKIRFKKIFCFHSYILIFFSTTNQTYTIIFNHFKNKGQLGNLVFPWFKYNF